MRLFFFLCLASMAAHAGFSVKPADVIKMNVGRGEYNSYIELAHTDGNIPHALELTVYERELDLNGNIKNEQNLVKDFTIVPSQILLIPGKSINAQIIYKGKKIEADKVYFLKVKELPLPEGQKESTLSIGLAIKINYNLAILMDTGKKTSALTFVSSKALDSGKVEVIMENKGQGRFSFKEKSLYANGKKVLEFLGEINSVMPGQQRRFVFDYDKPLTAKEIRIGK